MTAEKHGGNIYRAARKLGVSIEEIYDFSANINPLGTPEAVGRMIRENINSLLHYPDPEYGECREAIASRHGIPAEFIIPGNGATELIFLYARVLKPERCLIVSPTFSEYAKALDEAGSHIDLFRLREEDDFSLNPDELILEIQKGYDLVVICNPNNPTGALYPRADIERIAAAAAESKTRVMIDESFMEFTEDGEENSMIKNPGYDNLFILRSLTKILAIPGLRLGYAVSSDRDLNREINSRKEPWTVNVLASKTAMVMAENQEYIDNTRETVKAERELMIKNLNSLGWMKIYPSGVNYLLIKLSSGMTAEGLQKELLPYRIMIRDGSNFPFLDETFVRLAVKDRESNIHLIESLRKITQPLKF